MPGRIKICGVKTPAILDHVIASGADMTGFVHFARSPRHLPLPEIGALVTRAREGGLETAILLVDPDDALIDAATACGPDFLQLHGMESAERVADITKRTGVKIIKALPIGDAADVASVAGFAAVADRLILDARPPRAATRPGGLGRPFDWTLLKALDPALPFMLSGGLDADNVAQAVAEVRPAGLDVSSGVERRPGEKDAGLITAFIATARRAYTAIGM